MIEIPFDQENIKDIILGLKTMDVRLGSPEYIKLRIGDKLNIRQQDSDQFLSNDPIKTDMIIKIKQLLYFETIKELFSAISFKQVYPSLNSVEEAIDRFKKIYTNEDIKEYGVISIAFNIDV